MRKVVLFIAMSLDGYIADKHGAVNWLNGQDAGVETFDSYSVFIQDVDTVVMGWNTYHQIVTELSPTEWVYGNLTSYIITHRNPPSVDRDTHGQQKALSADNIIFTPKDPCSLINKLRQEQGKKIWICGGATIAQQLIEADLIDEYHVSIIPTILGSGIRLFEVAPKEIKLKLIHTQTYNGIAELIYTHRQHGQKL